MHACHHRKTHVELQLLNTDLGVVVQTDISTHEENNMASRDRPEHKAPPEIVMYLTVCEVYVLLYRGIVPEIVIRCLISSVIQILYIVLNF